MFISLFFISMPSFWVGLIFIYIFALGLRWFQSPAPAVGAPHPPGRRPRHRPIAVVGRVVRTSMLETLNNDFVVTARAKGLEERQVLFGHALRNALIPTITLIGLQFRLCPRRRGHHRNGLWPARDRRPGRRRRAEARLSPGAGHGPLRRVRLRARQPDRRSSVRCGRPRIRYE